MAGFFARIFEWFGESVTRESEVKPNHQMESSKVVTCPLHQLLATVTYTGVATPGVEGLRVTGCSIIGGVNTSIEHEFACSGACGALISESLEGATDDKEI